jgi:dTDP-4-amino-4,6-dideoxygalactose transaminase
MIPGHHPARLQEELTLPEHAGFGPAGGGWKYRAAPLAMAIAAAQLPRLDEWNAAKLENYTRLEARLRRIPFLRFPDLPPQSTRGFYGSPCWYGFDEGMVSRETFLAALAAEGAIVFTGYDNWYQTPIFQDMTLFRQFWVDRHVNGACYHPLSPGSLPHTDEAVRRTLVLPAWGKQAPDLVDQYATAFDKIAAHMGELAGYQARKHE